MMILLGVLCLFGLGFAVVVGWQLGKWLAVGGGVAKIRAAWFACVWLWLSRRQVVANWWAGSKYSGDS
jgi:hypothetical protein